MSPTSSTNLIFMNKTWPNIMMQGDSKKMMKTPSYTDLKQSEGTKANLSNTTNEEEKIVHKVVLQNLSLFSDERCERIRKATDKLRSPIGSK